MTRPAPELHKQPREDGPHQPIRVMIVDDSLTVRTVFTRMVEGDRSMRVVSSARNAERALMELRTTAVDVILLDLEMPGMGGLEALPKILERAKNAQVLVVSSLTEEGAEATLAALSMGAADTMLKPRPGGFDDNYRASLLGKIRALGGIDGDDRNLRETPFDAAETPNIARARKHPEIVAIGASTGGIHALNQILRDLPHNFNLPIVVTQHLPASFIPVFARQVEMAAARPTHIAQEGVEIRRGEIVIANGLGHLVARRVGDRLLCSTSDQPARSGCMPSVDPMLASLSRCLGGHVLGVILSGMGRDGAEGAASLVEAGGTILAQDAETSAVWGMPGAVTKAGLASAVLPPAGLVDAIVKYAGAAAWN